jgi:hypothetical protein
MDLALTWYMTYHVVDIQCLCDMRPMEVIPPGNGAWNACLGGAVYQAEICLNVCRFLILGE